MAEIRSYQTADFPRVKEILEASGLYYDRSDNRQSLEQKVQRDPDSILVAVEAGRAVGIVMIIFDFMPFMFRLAVDQLRQGDGIGTALMQRGEEIIKAKGYNHVNILVAADETELRTWYKKRGYEEGRNYVWMALEFPT